jgi:hypothetical protein
MYLNIETHKPRMTVDIERMDSRVPLCEGTNWFQ